MKYLFQTFFILISTISCGQYYADIEIPKSSLKPWKVNSIKEYRGIYKFGTSEGECELRVIISDTIIVAQTSCFATNELTGGFKDTFDVFTGVKINGTK